MSSQINLKTKAFSFETYLKTVMRIKTHNLQYPGRVS